MPRVRSRYTDAQHMVGLYIKYKGWVINAVGVPDSMLASVFLNWKKIKHKHFYVKP